MGDIADSFWEDYDYDYDYDPDDDQEPATPRCKFCGAKAETWIHTGTRWRLFDSVGGQLMPHSCRSRIADPTNDFEDCSK